MGHSADLLVRFGAHGIDVLGLYPRTGYVAAFLKRNRKCAEPQLRFIPQLDYC